jgi:hypothetical protein
MLNLIKLGFVYAGCYFFILVPSVIMLSGVMLNVMAPNKKNEFLKEKISNLGKGGFFAKEEKSFKLLIILQKRSFQIGWKEKDHCNLVDHSGQFSKKVAQK